jgi:hypothetical protein
LEAFGFLLVNLVEILRGVFGVDGDGFAVSGGSSADLLQLRSEGDFQVKVGCDVAVVVVFGRPVELTLLVS